METKFVYQEKNGLGVYQVPLFTKNGLTKHGFTTRKGGVSPYPFASLNLAFHTGDIDKNVRKNRELVSSAFDLDLANWVAGKQIHGDRIMVITGEERGNGAKEYSTALEDTDALITNLSDVVLTSYCADCVTILLYDPRQKVIGIAHAGWRGTVERIGVKTLEKMQEVYGSSPKDCLIAIGPSIGPCCFEIDKKIVELWQKNFPNWPEVIRAKKPENWLINLWETNRRQFLEIDVPAEKITVSELCTFCGKDLFFSYRAEKGNTGRMAAFISL